MTLDVRKSKCMVLAPVEDLLVAWGIGSNITYSEAMQMYQLGLSSFSSEATNIITGSQSHDII